VSAGPGDTPKNRDFGDAHHSAAGGLVVAFNQQNDFAVEANMQRVAALMSYVVNEGRVCALKPSEWSLLLAGVALCGLVTVLYLMAGV